MIVGNMSCISLNELLLNDRQNHAVIPLFATIVALTTKFFMGGL